MAFALGAIVSPTDPAAATGDHAACRAAAAHGQHPRGREPVQRRDRLVAYKVAVAAAIGETVSTGHTVLEFFVEAGGGIAIGLAVGFVIGEVRRRVTDINTELTISLFSAYGAFVPADQLGVSGVLAVVACGVYLGWRAPEIASPESRMQGDGAVVDPHLPAQRRAVHPHRPAAAVDRRRAAGLPGRARSSATRRPSARR
jgi:CPA1 family monovalent cation:H+ antiporter